MGVRGKENFFLKSFPSPENLHLQQPHPPHSSKTFGKMGFAADIL